MAVARVEDKIERELERIVRQLVRHLDPEKIFLFGSFANSSFHAWSDIDLLLVMETPLRFHDRIELALSVIRTRHPVDILIYTPGELQAMLERGNDFISTALEEAKLLYEKKAIPTRRSKALVSARLL